MVGAFLLSRATFFWLPLDEVEPQILFRPYVWQFYSGQYPPCASRRGRQTRLGCHSESRGQSVPTKHEPLPAAITVLE